MSEDWVAVILAGGIGSRLFPLTQEKPKPMLEIANRPMIDYAINLVMDAGIKKIIIAVKYKGNLIREWIDKQIAEGYFQDCEIIIPEIDSKDTADVLRQISNYDRSLLDGNIVITMADIVTNMKLKDAMNFHMKHPSNPIATICLKPVETPGQFGLTMLDNDNKIHLFLEKPTPNELLMTTKMFIGKKATRSLQHNLANIGIYVFDNELVDIIMKHSELMDFGSNVFPYLLDHKYDVRGYLSNPYWVDAGIHEKYIWANNDVLKKKSKPYLARENERNEFEFIGENVEIGDGCIITPPVLIGDNCRIDSNSIIGPYVSLGKNIQIGKKVKITNSIVMDNVSIIKDGSIDKCILSENVNIETSDHQYKMVVPSNIKLLQTNNDYRY